jgi:hypothetical protein
MRCGIPGAIRRVVVTLNVVPEPTSLVLLDIGLLGGVLGYARHAGRRAAA